MPTLSGRSVALFRMSASYDCLDIGAHKLPVMGLRSRTFDGHLRSAVFWILLACVDWVAVCRAVEGLPQHAIQA